MGIKYTTMEKLRRFSGWRGDNLDIDDDEDIIVWSTGKVVTRLDGEVLCRDGFGGHEGLRMEWMKYFGFKGRYD